MGRKVEIYDKDKLLGSVTIDGPIQEGMLTEIIEIHGFDEEAYALHVIGMDYATLVPVEFAKKFMDVYCPAPSKDV